MTDPPSELPAVVERFLRYVQVDTRADRRSESVPSTEKQKDLSRLLVEELERLGLEAQMDPNGYVYASLEGSGDGGGPVVALFAHVDTSPDEPGGPVRPLIWRNYDGGVIELPGDPSVRLDPDRSPALLDHVGHHLITSDGTTLLGSDDKAGVAIIMQAVADLVAQPSLPRPPLRICFTVDEEIGRGVDHLDLRRLGADIGYTVDGGAVGTLDVETFHAAEAHLRVRGVNVHPGTAKGVMVNAATILCELLTRLPGGERPETTAGDEGYYCPYEIRGSVAEAEARILLRDFEAAGIQRRKDLVARLVGLARSSHPTATIELNIVDQYRNLRADVDRLDPRAIELAMRAGEEIGLEMREEKVRGGTDGARLSALGLPTPNLFTGGFDFHSRFEWNTVQNLTTAVGYVKSLLRLWSAVESRREEEVGIGEEPPAEESPVAAPQPAWSDAIEEPALARDVAEGLGSDGERPHRWGAPERSVG